MVTTPEAFNPSLPVPMDDDRDGGLPPALVEAIRDDPSCVAPVARVYGITVLHDMYMQSKSFTVAQQRDFVELCAKLGDMMPKQRMESVASPGFNVVINIPGSPEKSISVNAEPFVIENTDG